MVFDVVMVMVMVIGAALGTVAATHLSIVIHVVVVVVVVAVVIWAALGTVAAKHLSMVLDVVVVVMVMLMMVMVVVAVVTGAALGTVAATHLSAWAAAALSWRWSFLLAAVACAKLLNWIPLLYALFGLYVLMFLAFGLGGTCEEQWWNNPKDDKTS
ncbi:Protein of unknown function [Gryllus bimaculatus]|nr:Protein of unknown function [Gryllus bimaculatus]